jgi:hypothetical protein
LPACGVYFSGLMTFEMIGRNDKESFVIPGRQSKIKTSPTWFSKPNDNILKRNYLKKIKIKLNAFSN